MSNIFKIYNVNYDNEKQENIITNVYVFIKNLYFNNTLTQSVIDLNAQFSSNIKEFISSSIYEEIFEDCFDDLEKKQIMEYNPKIYFIDENIYGDDSIETIKFKFLKNYNMINESEKLEDYLSFEEIYMFMMINKTYDPIEIFNSLTNNNKNKLTKKILFDYLINLNEQKEILEKIGTKDIYSYEDLYNIKLESINLFVSLGQNINNKLNFAYNTNPMQVQEFNNII